MTQTDTSTATNNVSFQSMKIQYENKSRATKDYLLNFVRSQIKQLGMNYDMFSIRSQQPEDDVLICGAIRGDIEMIKWALQKGADVHVGNGSTKDVALLWAAERGHLKIVQALLAPQKFDLDCEALNPHIDDGYALTSAARNGHWDVVYFLLTPQKYGYDFQPLNIEAPSFLGAGAPLRSAVGNGHIEIVRLLLDPQKYGIEMTGANPQNNKGLVWAAKDGHVEIVRLLLSRGADIHMPTIMGDSDGTLRYAAQQGHFQIVEMLLEPQKYNLDTPPADIQAIGKTILESVLCGHHLRVLKLLMSHGLNFCKAGNYHLNLAIQHEDFEMAKILLWPQNYSYCSKGAKLKHGDSSALVAAASHNEIELTKLLLTTGADIDGWIGAALRKALLAGHTEMVDLLLHPQNYGLDVKGADVQIAGQGFACQLSLTKSAEMIGKLLVARGSLVSSRGKVQD